MFNQTDYVLNAPKIALQKFLLLLFFPVFIQPGVTSAQFDPSYPPFISVTQDLFDDPGILEITYSSPWFYKAGDDTSWADPNFIRNEFIHEKWPDTDQLSTIEFLSATPPEPFIADGNVWFFKELRVDSSEFGKRYAITGKIQGALELYINGNRAGAAGQVGSNRGDEVARGQFLPISFEWDHTDQQFIALRYSYHELIEVGPEAFILGLKLYMGPFENIEQHFQDRAAERSISMAAQSFSMGASTGLGILLLFLYILYPRQRLNLIAALLFILVGLSSIGIFYITIWEVPRDFFMAMLITGIGISVSSFVNVWFAYKLIQKKRNWVLWVFGFFTVLLTAFTFYSPLILQNAAMLLWLISMVYTLVLFASTRFKKNLKDLDIILIGFGIYFIGFITFLILIVIGYLPQSSAMWISVLSLLVPISYSFYLARDVARTSELLSRKLDENQRLADEKLRQEQENKRLIETRKEELEEEVKARTAELAKAYENLKKSHEDLKNTQQQLIQQEKMASLGQLTAGIAHEIKNPLNFVNNFSDVSRELIAELREELDRLKQDKKADLEGSFVEEILGDIEANVTTITKHGKRADSIVHGMLLHSRGKSGEKMPTDINKLLDEYTDLSYHGLRAKDPDFNADIQKDFDPSIEKIELIPQDISRAFLNIINNGFQAAYEHFRKQGIKANVLLSVKTELSGGNVIIRIKDNGPGIPEKIKNKIFEPFFTTKDAGEGTGLGLSMTYDIIKSHNGTIDLLSEEGKGTEFVITLPAGK